MANISPIHTEEDYEAALSRLAEIFQAEIGTPDGDEREILSDLVKVYEEKHYPIGPPDPIAAIEFHMGQANLTPRDLIPFIGSQTEVAEVLSGKRDLTMSMARALHKHLGIPAESLLQEPGARERTKAAKPRPAPATGTTHAYQYGFPGSLHQYAGIGL